MRNCLIKIVRKKDNKTFVIGGNNNWRLLKKGLEGFGSYTNKINYTDNATFDGGTIDAISMTKVNRTIKCAFVDLDNNEKGRTEVLSFFNPKETYKVYMTYGEKTVWAEGVVYKFALTQDAKNISRMDLTITFTFADPYLKSFDDFGKNIALRIGKTAFPYMVAKKPGLTGGIFGFAKEVIVENDGDVETRCRALIRATDGVVNPALFINDKYVRILDTLEANDEIEIDFTVLPPTVKKNGVNFLGHCDRTSSFFDMVLNVGENTVKFDADDGDKNLAVYIYYNKLYAAV